MSRVSDEMSMFALAESLRSVVRREAVRCGSVPIARKALAHRYRVALGTLERAERGRSKRVDQRLVDLVIKEVTDEWKRLEHELMILKQMGSDPRLSRLPEIETQLAALRQMLAL